tara:strand:- start:3894 stop:4748 length:855 start_codon:yes stop_codon:yes gene_type:complete
VTLKKGLNIYRNSFPIILFKSPIALVSGGFDPIHSGHIKYIKEAKRINNKNSFCFVGLNSDEWLKRKKGKYFMPFEERAAILNEIDCVDAVVSFDDSDNTAINFIKKIRMMYPEHQLYFCNGGDRTKTNIPEMNDDKLIRDDKLMFQFGVGGSYKKNSSSWILEEYKAPKTKRSWGFYRILQEWGSSIKLKELTVDPGQKLSMQKHKMRNEFWFIAEGSAALYTINKQGKKNIKGYYKEHDSLFIKTNEWHQLANEHQVPLKVIEIQYGDKCIEDDIERLPPTE